MKKRFKTKKRFNFRKYLVIMVIGVIIKFFPNYNINLFNSDINLINKLLNSSNHYIAYKRDNSVFSNVFDFVLGVEISNPLSIISKKFDYDIEGENDNIVFMANNNNEVVSNKKHVYIYSSHQTEGYNNGETDVFLVSKMLKEKLEKLGISTLVEEGNFTEFMRVNNYTHAYSYVTSRYFIESVIKENNFDLIIDLHRDSNNKQSSTVNIDGKDYAKVLFVVGLENENYQVNLELATKINNLILNKYPGLSRGIYKKEGAGVDGVYNQDLNDKMILLEIGGYQNTKEEVNNTLEIISEIIKQYLEES